MRGLVLLCLLASVFAGFGVGPESLLKKYANTMVLTSCFGEDVIAQYEERHKAAAEDCRDREESSSSEESSEEEEKEPEIDTKTKSKLLAQSSPVPQNVKIQFVPVPFAYNPFGLHQGPYPHFLSHEPQTRRRRHSDAENKLENIKKRIIKKVENAACVHKKLDYMDENEMPKPNSLKTEVEKLNISKSLKDDLIEAISHCYDFATCLPSKGTKHPLVQKLGKFTAFMRCLFMKEMIVCMKQDFTKYAKKNDLDGEEEVFELMMTFGDGNEEPDFF